MADDEWQYEPEEFDDPAQTPQAPREEDTASASDQETDETDTEASGWRFSLEDLESEGSPGQERSLSASVTPGSPDLENAVFVAFGVALGLIVAWQFLL